MGLTFTAYRRIGCFMIVGGGRAFPGRTEMIPVTKADVAHLITQDIAPVKATPALPSVDAVGKLPHPA